MRARLSELWDRLRTSYWFVPLLVTVGAALLAIVMRFLDELVPHNALDGAWFIYRSDAENARTLLLAIAGGTLGLIGAVFSITMLPLTIADTSFSLAAQRGRRSPFVYDDTGALRVIADPLAFAHMLDSAFNQIRQYGRGDAEVLIRMLRTLATVGARAERPEGRAVLLHHARLVEFDSRPGLPDPRDQQRVRAASPGSPGALALGAVTNKMRQQRLDRAKTTGLLPMTEHCGAEYHMLRCARCSRGYAVYLETPMRWITLGIIATLLAACATAPAPAPTNTVAPAPASTDTVVQTLTTQLHADQVVVQNISLTPASPMTLTVEYMLNEQKLPLQTQQALEVMLALESERSVQAITRRVVQQVAAGVPIARVILREHLGTAPAQSLLVNVSDMQAWASGAINDDQYRARWCCTLQ